MPEEKKFLEFMERKDYAGALDLLSRIGECSEFIRLKHSELYRLAYREAVERYSSSGSLS